MVYDGDVEKAIELYANVEKNIQSHYDYRGLYRNSLGNSIAEFTEMDILNYKNNMFIHCDDIVKMDLKIKAKQHRDNLCIRIEVFSADGTIVGTSFSHASFSINSLEQKQIIVNFNTSHLVPGYYKLCLLLFDKGSYFHIDRIEPAAVIEIVQKELGEMEWKPQVWGHIQLEPMEFFEK